MSNDRRRSFLPPTSARNASFKVKSPYEVSRDKDGARLLASRLNQNPVKHLLKRFRIPASLRKSAVSVEEKRVTSQDPDGFIGRGVGLGVGIACGLLNLLGESFSGHTHVGQDDDPAASIAMT